MALTYQQFGAKIKSKYPEYNDMDDGTLGKKMLEKYPQYQDMVETREQKIAKYNQETESLRGEAKKAGSLGGIIKETAKGLPKAALEVGVGTPAKFLASALEAPKAAITGKASQRTYDLPGLEPFKSYQSEAETRAGDIVEGKKPLYTAAAPFIQVPLAGMETLFLGSAASKGYKAAKNIKSFKSALKMIVPSKSTALGKKGSIEAIKKSGKDGGARISMTGKVSIKPTKAHIKEANTIAPFAKSNNPVKTATNVNNEIKRYSEKVVEPFLENNKTPVNYTRLKSMLNKSKPKELVKGTDGEKVFNRIKSFYVKNTSGAKDNLSLWKSRSKIDNLFKQEYGDALYNTNSPQHIPVKDAYYKMRRAVNEYLSEANSPIYGPAMDRLSTLYNALDDIAINNRGIIGTGKVGRYLKEHPLVKKGVYAGASGAGLGGGYAALQYLMGKK